MYQNIHRIRPTDTLEPSYTTCISYYMATSVSIWHMRTRGHVISNLLYDNGMAVQYWYDNELAVQYIIYWHSELLI